MKLNQKDNKILLYFSIILTIVTGYMFYAEFELTRPWKKIQRDFVKIDQKLTSAELQQVSSLPDSEFKQEKIARLKKKEKNLSKASPVIKQLWLTDLDKTDRCITCHLGAESERFLSQEQPFTTHPGKHIDSERHSVDKYGCVICHDGQGVGLTTYEAHGKNHNFMEPLLVGKKAESSCESCHQLKGNIAKNAILEDAPSFSAGRTLYLTNNCLGCHQLDKYSRDAGIGPILTPIATKSNGAWIKSWIKQPRDYLINTEMPDFQLNDDKVEAINAYLISLTTNLDISEKSSARYQGSAGLGEQKLTDLGCLGCHSVDGKDEGFGPDLSKIGSKANPQWLYSWIENPESYWPETSMPNLRIPKQDIDDLVAYLTTLGAEESNTTVRAEKNIDLIARGKALTIETGCTGCHQIESFSLGFNAPNHDGIGAKRVDELVFGNTDIDHSLADWLTLKVKNPKAFNTEEMPTLMPDFNFTDEEAEDLLTFLLSIKHKKIPAKYQKSLHDPSSPRMIGEKIIEENNCLGCHKIKNTGGDIGPDLSFEGSRVNPEWLVKFLKVPSKIRPIGIEPTRMPTFDLTKDETESLAAYFADLNDVDFPYYDKGMKKQKQEARDTSWKLFWQTFSCQSCHSWNGTGGVIGPDQSDIAKRLKLDWVKKYLKNPQSFIPDVHMPNFEMYPDEIENLSHLIMDFNEISPSVWDQIKREWEDELLARQAEAMAAESRN